MRKARQITAREFEFIVPKELGRANCHAVEASDFAALREFALANREGESPLELMRLCSPKGIGEAIQLQNYVGVVETKEGLQIEVLPKIDVAPEAGINDREVFARMLSELGTETSFKAFERAGLSTGAAPLFEVFVSMFLDEVTALVRRGVRSSYVDVESEERFVRGKIDFAKEAKKGPGRAERMHLVHDELLHDCPENRLMKSTLTLLQKSSREPANIRLATQLVSAFDDVGHSLNVEADLARCVADRSTKSYGILIAWCRVFLRGESFTMFRGENIATALLFPMERIFEDYVGKMLRRVASKDASIRRVMLQAKGQWLFEGRRVSLRPDILCECANGRQVILDTKWKLVSGPKDLSAADMHQMYAYGQRYRAEGEQMQHVVLLYPWHEGVVSGVMPTGRHVSSDGVQVDMFYFDLGNARKSVGELLELVKRMAEAER